MSIPDIIITSTPGNSEQEAPPADNLEREISKSVTIEQEIPIEITPESNKATTVANEIKLIEMQDLSLIKPAQSVRKTKRKTP